MRCGRGPSAAFEQAVLRYLLSAHKRLDDPESAVSKKAKSGRSVKLLEELGTQPRVTYLKGGA